jgi:8-amino-7-oxononanoate synthase
VDGMDQGVEVNSVAQPKLLEKCFQFTKADELCAVGMYPYFRVIDSAQDTEVFIRGKRMLMLGSNSYMGLTNDPRVKAAAIKAVEKYGSGCAGSRFLNGTLDIHIELEEKLAEFVGKEAALCFTTGFQANLGAISALVHKDDVVIIDRFDHASIIDGSRLAFGKTLKFDHNDISDLERVLANCGTNGKLIVVDGVYSMEGDIAPLPAIIELAKKYNAAIMVDDAHAIGVLGEKGNGTAAHFGLTDDVDLIMGTFSKSLASIGGFIAAKREVIQYLKHFARALIFSASMAPPCVAAVLEALDIIINEPERRERLWYNAHYFQSGLQELGYDTGRSQTPVIPVILGDDELVFKMWRMLHEEGVFVNPVVSPAVPPGKALLRLSVMATHTEQQLRFALDRMECVGKVLHVI